MQLKNSKCNPKIVEKSKRVKWKWSVNYRPMLHFVIRK